MKRRDDWMQRLQECVAHARVTRFEYGSHDCCTWAAQCVDAMCGTHLLEDIHERYNYSTEDGALAICSAVGGLATLVGERLGAPQRASFAAPGDVVLARDGHERPIVGVVVGHQVVVPGDAGIVCLGFERIAICWKV